MSFSDFFQDNLLLFLAGIALLAFIISQEFIGSSNKSLTVTPTGLSRASNDGAKIIDLRTPEAFAQSHIPNAKNIPFAELDDNIKKISVRKKPTIFYCDKGRTSLIAVKKLQAEGIEIAFSLEGGMTGWIKEGLPTKS